MASYDAQIRIAVTGQQQIDAAIGKINGLQKAINAIAGKLGLGSAVRETQQLAGGFDQVAKSIRGAKTELQQFIALARSAPQAPQPRFAPPRSRGPRQPVGLLPPAAQPLAGRTPRLPEAPRSTGNFNAILDRLAGATTSLNRAQALLRALPENRITTDLAGRASAQRRAFETVPALGNAAAASRYFDPVLKEIAQEFAKYQREIRPTANDRRAVGPISQETSGEFAAAGRAARELEKSLFALNRRVLSGSTALPALPPGVQGGQLGTAGRVPINNIRALPPGRSIPASEQIIDVQAARVADAAGDLAQAIRRGTQEVNAAAGGGGRGGRGGGRGGGGFYGPNGGQGSFFPPGFNGGVVPPGGFPFDGPRPPRPFSEGRRFRLPRFSAGSALSEAAIGGAFPLLFGAGPISSFGGALGGALGGFGPGLGFAGGLVGSLIGKFGDSLGAVGESLKSPIDALESLKTVGISVGSELEDTVRSLSNLGRAAEAQQLILNRLQELGGTEYVRNLVELGKAQKELSDEWSKLSALVQAELLPAFIAFTRAVIDFVKVLQGAALTKKSRDIDAAQFEKDRAAAAAVGRKIGGPAGIQAEQKELARLSALRVAEAEKKAAAGGLPSVELSPADQRKTLDEAIAQQKEIEDLRRRGIQLEISQADFRRDQEEAIYNFRKRADDYTREVTEFRRDIEEKIADKQRENARVLADLTRQRAQNAIERQDQALEPLGRISPLEGGGRAVGVDLVREYIRARAEGEADLQQKETETQLKIQEIRSDSDKFRLDVEKKVYDFQQKAEQFARDVTKYEFETAKKVYALEIEAADYQYATWENAYKRAGEISRMMREAAANPLGDLTGGGEGPVIGGTAGLRQGIERIRGAYSFRGTTLAQNKRPGDYQSDPRENFFFDFQPRSVIEAAKRRVATLTSGDIAALTLTVLTEAGPTNIGKFDVAANLITRSAMAGNQPISRIAAAPGQYEGVFSRGLTIRQLEDPAVGRRLFGSAFDVWFRRFGGFGKGSEATTGTAANALGTPIGSQVGSAAPAAATPPTARPVLRQGSVLGAALPQRPVAPNVDALVQSYQGLNEEQTRLLQSLQEEFRIRTQLADLAAQAKLTEGVAAIGQQFLQPMIDARQAAEDRFATEQQYSDLLSNGVLPDLAEQLSQNRELERTQLRLLDIQLKATQAAQAQIEADIEINRLTTARTDELDKQLTNLLRVWAGLQEVNQGLGDTRAAIIGQADRTEAQLAQNESPEARRQRTIDEYNRRRNERQDPNRRFDVYMTAKADLEDLVDPANQIISAANGIGDAFGNAFKDIASGSKTAQEALSDMFANIGASFLDMAAKILAQQLVLSIIGAFGFGGGGAGGGGVGGFITGGLFDSGIGAGFSGARASGGPVSGNSTYLVGEQGPELFVPGVSGSILSAQETEETLKPSGEYNMGQTGNDANVVYSGPILRFNEQDYVSKGDIPKIIRSSVIATGREMRVSVPFRKRAGV